MIYKCHSEIISLHSLFFPLAANCHCFHLINCCKGMQNVM